MSFNENLRGHLNRWVHRNSNLAIEHSKQKSESIGRHAIVQDIAMVSGKMRFGKRHIIKADQCSNSIRGRKLRNMILNYNVKKQAVVVFRDIGTKAEMTVMLNHTEMVSHTG